MWSVFIKYGLKPTESDSSGGGGHSREGVRAHSSLAPQPGIPRLLCTVSRPASELLEVIRASLVNDSPKEQGGRSWIIYGQLLRSTNDNLAWWLHGNRSLLRLLPYLREMALSMVSLGKKRIVRYPVAENSATLCSRKHPDVWKQKQGGERMMVEIKAMQFLYMHKDHLSSSSTLIFWASVSGSSLKC